MVRGRALMTPEERTAQQVKMRAVKTYDALLWKGIKEGLKIVLMVFGAFVILNILRETGAIEEVKNTIARISDDRRVQVVIIGMMLPIFLEGAAMGRKIRGAAPPPAAQYAPFRMNRA